jgi:hypothetical protein
MPELQLTKLLNLPNLEIINSPYAKRPEGFRNLCLMLRTLRSRYVAVLAKFSLLAHR